MFNPLHRHQSRHERGQALVATTCLIVALMGFAALATDIGYMYSVRRHMQTAADAAAVAAANQLNVGAATDVTALNGFTNGQNNTTVVVTPTTNPTGYPSGSYYQVTVTEQVPTFFLKVLGYKNLNVSTTAMAGNVNNASTLMALNGSSSGITVDSGAAVTVGGSSATQQGGCGIVSNAGLTNSGTVTAPSIGVVTSVSGTKPANTTTGITPISDPVAPCVSSAKTAGALTGNSCSFASTAQVGTYTCNKSETITPTVYDGSGSTSGTYCGYACVSPTKNGTAQPINVTFNTNGGTCGNRVSCGANDQGTSGAISNSTITLGPGQYQCSTSSGGWGGWYGWGGWGGSTASCSLEVGTYASGCTVTCSGGGNYTFLGNVSCSGNNTVNLQPGSYYGGITVTGTSTAAPTVNFAPGTYIIGGGGLNVSGQCTLKGTGCTFYNTTDTSPLASTAGPITVGGHSDDNVTCNLSAPTSGSCKGLLLCQDSAVSGSSGWGWWYSGGSGSTSQCHVHGCSGSTFDGAVYTPGASLEYCGSSSSSHGYTVLAADSVELSSGASTQVSCDYSNLSSGMSPITTAALYK